MFLKRLIRFTLIAIAMLFILAACAPRPTSSAVDVPEAIELAVGTLILAVLTAGFVFLFEKTGLDLRGFALPVSVAISAFLVAQLQGLINTIPPQYDPLLSTVLQIIVVIIGGLGVLRLRSNARARLL
jgi:hypothetical protein